MKLLRLLAKSSRGVCTGQPQAAQMLCLLGAFVVANRFGGDEEPDHPPLCIDANEVEKDAQKTYQQIITSWIEVGENEPVKIPAADEAAAEAQAETASAVETPASAGDDLTTLNGVRAVIVGKLAGHCITSFADFAATTAEQREALTEEMKVLRRYDVIGRADAIAAEAVAA